MIHMKIGWIGAGKTGVSLGRYFCEHQIPIAGYYSKSIASAQEAAKITGSKWFTKLQELVECSDILFVTTTDSAISEIWAQLRDLPIENKILCHCSGSLSSGIFSERQKRNAYGYSVHPLLAIHDKYTGHTLLRDAVFTIEGDPEHLSDVTSLFAKTGNPVQVIDSAYKTLYHCAAVTVSNHVLALLDCGIEMLTACGFSREQALAALTPLVHHNVETALRQDVVPSLTGPVERGDVETVAAHLACLSSQRSQQQLYRLLADRLADIARVKHPGRDDSEMRKMLGGLFL